LSFFLWSRGPDEQLLQLATAGKLKDPATLQAQVRRMLTDERSKSLISNFANQWLNVENLDNVDPDGALFPSFDEELRRGFRCEMELFADSILRNDGRITDLLSADYSFLNERLALHYGVPNVRGDQFRRVQLTDTARWGLLGKGAMLMSTSYGNRTAPVLRGNWILERVLGTPPSAPPPGVEALKENTPGAPPSTVRQRLELHRAQPSCNGCHAVMDPLGFALENFDVAGGWRGNYRSLGEDGEPIEGFGKNGQPFTFRKGPPVDASGNLPNGKAFKNIEHVKKLLIEDERAIAKNLLQQLTVYATGAPMCFSDRVEIEQMLDRLAKDEYRVKSIITEIVTSNLFLSK
jgi:hypothetical protein